MDRRVDAHRYVVGILTGDALVHLEQIAVSLADDVLAQALDRIAEVEVHSLAAGADPPAFIAHPLGGTGADVTRYQVAVTRVYAFEKIIAILCGDLVGQARVPLLLGHPDAPIITQRLAHQGQLGLMLSGHRNTGRVDLRETGIGKSGPAFVGAPDGCDVTPLGVGRQIKGIAIATSSEHHGIGSMGSNLPCHQIARHYAARLAVDDHKVEHLSAWVHLHLADVDLACQGLICSEQQLLPRLPPAVEGTGYLCAAKRACIEQPAVFTRERHALRHTLIDDVNADLRQAMDIGLAGAVVTTFNRVIEQAIDAVAIVTIVFRGVDAPLGGDAVGAAWAVLEAEAFDLIPQLGERRGGRGSGKS